MQPVKVVKLNDEVTLSGLDFKVVDKFIGDCSKCGRRHQIVELSRDFIIFSGGVRYHADQRYMYCTYTGERYVTPGQSQENHARILNAESVNGRRWMPSTEGGIR